MAKIKSRPVTVTLRRPKHRVMGVLVGKREDTGREVSTIVVE